MAQSNRERVGRALDLLKEGLAPYIERRMKATFSTRWREQIISNLQDYQLAALKNNTWDIQILFSIMWDYWQAVFKSELGHTERSLVSELRETRNRWAHQEAFSTDDTYRALDSIQRLLNAISAAPQATEVEQDKYELMRARFEEQTRQATRKANTAPLGSQTSSGLQPWRNIVAPHPDVASGRYQIAEFAADLAQVYKNIGSDEYRDPRSFFQRTYLTYGLRQLLIRALQRLSGEGGDPVVELQTNFGGGKTHSLLALYHLFSGTPLEDLVGIEPLMREAGVTTLPQAQRSVLVGHELSPALPRVKEDGCVVNTLWGELAWQLLGRDGYTMVAEADQRGVSPGTEVLRDLFAAAAPSLVLIDEWVVYARQLYDNKDQPLPGGSFDTNLSFAQSLTEAARAVPQTMVVVSIPASDAEKGGEGGNEASRRLKSVIGRVESPWRPADAEEGFEIVRRRLFEPISDRDKFIARDAVARAFSINYREHTADFPPDCREARYEERIKAAYPIHPELFDRLYTDWSSNEKFQRTRGVLRFMAAVVHKLWQNQDSNLLILPASVPVGDNDIKPGLMRYLEDNWDPVIDKDIDGAHSLPVRLDGENSQFGRYSACRRIARTIYLGSAPNPLNPNKGLTVQQIKLGCTQPGENAATFGDALRSLADQSTHLYLNEQKYWYATQPSVTRLALDRAAQYSDDRVYQEIEQRLQSEKSKPGDFARVHPCPASSGNVADDEFAVSLVILKPLFTHARGDNRSSAWQEAIQILNQRGNSSRNNKNTLIFLAADRVRVEELKQGVRLFLAWDSIVNESEQLNLDAFQRTQANTQRQKSHETVTGRIPETYTFLLVPEQEDLNTLTLEERRITPQPQISLAVNASAKLREQELLITRYAGTLLRSEIDRIPLWRENNRSHVSVKQLAEDFARYVYLPRLKNLEVLLSAIRDGVQSPNWQKESFAYADSWDAEQQRYLGLKTAQQIALSGVPTGLIVKPAAAAAQLAADEAERARKEAERQAYSIGSTTSSNPHAVQQPTPGATTGTGASHYNPAVTPAQKSYIYEQPLFPDTGKEPRKQRFHGAVKINPRMMAGDAGKIMEEVVKHLTSLSKDGVSVTLEIQASIPDGIPDDVQRVVQENSRTLRFESAEFEGE